MPAGHTLSGPSVRIQIFDPQDEDEARLPGGGVTIAMSHREPTAAANWLPAPPGGFRPVLRVYIPGQDVIDGTYTLPPIRRVG